MIQLDYSLLLQIVNFVVLIFLLNILLYKPMLSVIDKRKRRLEESEEEIIRLKRTVEEKMADYEDKVRSTRSEYLGKNKGYVKEGADKAKEIIDETGREISLMVEEFSGRLEKEVHVAREFLSGQSRVLSVEIAEKALGRRIP
ncbi:MAG: ATP synthase F0 subunit B [Syntrophales bacterium]|nr:ATP synthase F0 subunit B [Syntrophales bacterium]